MGKKAFKYDKVLCKKFGQKVRKLRKNFHIHQDEFAFRINISTSYLSTMENGKTDVTISTVKRIAKVAGVEMSQLFEFE